MRKVGELSWNMRSYNTCEHQGRVFNFAPDYHGKLVVSELFLGEEVQFRRVNTGVDCKCNSTHFLSCCPFGGKILLMAGNWHAIDFFCALVSIDLGELTEESIHIEAKNVIRLEKYISIPFLVQISENKAWVSFMYSSRIWIGELKGDDLVMTKHPDHLPVGDGFSATPLRLPDGRFLVAGGWPDSTSIVLITPGEQFSFEKVGDIPGEGRYGVSTILIGERFVLGFGGRNSANDIKGMWIFDLKTHRVSPVTKQGEWHPGGVSPALAVRDKELYVIGGTDTWSAHCLSFSALSRLIQHGGVRCAFCSCLGFPIQPSKAFKKSIVIDYIPTLL